MNKIAIAFVLLAQVIFILLKISSGCDSCKSYGSFDFYLSLSGLGFYSTMLVLQMSGYAISKYIFFACVIHAALLLISFRIGYWCDYCTACAANAVIAFVLTDAFKHMRAARLVLMSPLLITALLIPVAGGVKNDDNKVVLIAYVKDECPYCEILTSEILPKLNREQVTVKVIDSGGALMVPLFPTIVISKGRYVKVIGGLPEAETLALELEKARRS